MKKKGARDIPNFGGRPPSKVPLGKLQQQQQQQQGVHGSLPTLEQTQAPKPSVEAPRVKPPSTSAKSGRRGS